MRILSGYKQLHWGLGEIELFGSGANYLPDDDWFHVNVDLLDLKPAETIHCRLVAISTKGTTRRPDQQFRLPSTTRPRVITGPASRIENGTAKVEDRSTPSARKRSSILSSDRRKTTVRKSRPATSAYRSLPASASKL